jgi:hypothetical protein
VKIEKHPIARRNLPSTSGCAVCHSESDPVATHPSKKKKNNSSSSSSSNSENKSKAKEHQTSKATAKRNVPVV